MKRLTALLQEAGVYAIDVETDRGCLAPDAMLTSAIKHLDWAAVEQAKVDIVSGAVEELTRKNRLPKGVWKIRK